MTDKKKTNLFGKLFGRFKKSKSDQEGHEDFDENEDYIEEGEYDSDETAPGIRFEDIEEDEDEIFVAQEFSVSDQRKKELEDEDRTGEHDVQSMLSESDSDEDELPPAPGDEEEYLMDEEVDLPPAPGDGFDDDMDGPPEDFPIEETPPLHVDEEGQEIPSIPIGDDELPEAPAVQMEEMPSPKKPNLTENRPIDLDAIKNYEFTDEDDDQEGEETLSAYKMFDPTKHAKGIRAFLEKSKEKLGNIKLDGLKEKFKNFSSKDTIKNFKTPKFIKNFKWDKAIDALYHPDSRRMIHRGFIASSVVAGTWSMGKIVALSLKGPPDTTVSKSAPILMSNNGSQFNYQDVDAIRTANLFNAKMSKDEPKLADEKPKVIDSPEVCTKASKKSSLPYKLVNTTVLQDSVKSIASVQVRSANELEDLRVGDKIAAKAEIGFIDRMKVIFKNLSTGECEYIANEDLDTKDAKQQFNIVSPEEGKKIIRQTKNEDIKNEGNSYRIKKSVRDNMLGNISEILTQARAIQIKNPDGSYSFKMTEIVPGSVYSQLGIQDGDIITQINGKKITNLNEVMALFGKIKDIDQFQLNVKRGGIETQKEYEFE
jgi:type II secretory pathway component PulC